MTVDMKSRAESTSDAITDNDDDVKATIHLAISRNTFAAKLINMARLTIREFEPSGLSSGSSADSSLNETRREGGCENIDGR